MVGVSVLSVIAYFLQVTTKVPVAGTANLGREGIVDLQRQHHAG